LPVKNGGKEALRRSGTNLQKWAKVWHMSVNNFKSQPINLAKLGLSSTSLIEYPIFLSALLSDYLTSKFKIIGFPVMKHCFYSLVILS